MTSLADQAKAVLAAHEKAKFDSAAIVLPDTGRAVLYYEAAPDLAQGVLALREALRPIVREYDLWSEDANDGEFRLWDLDRLVMAIVNARAALRLVDGTEDGGE